MIFEVGGNIGEDTQQFTLRFPAAKIFTFEPVPELFHTLQRKFGDNPNVRLQQVGISNKDGQTTFIVAGRHGEGTVNNSHSASTWGEKITVQLRDVHGVLTQIQQQTGQVPDVATINCEGCEYDVLGRMSEMGWLGKIRLVQMSWHAVAGISNRVQRRCAIEQVLWQHYEPEWHSLYGWQAWKLKVR